MFIAGINLIFAIFYFQNVSAYSVETHAGLTKEIFKFYNQHSQINKIPDSFKDYLIEGSRQEDIPPRWMNHYYDPVYDRGLTSGLYGNWGKSKTWAQASDEQNKLIYKVPVVLASILSAIEQKKISAITSETNFTWQRAIEFYLNNEKEKAFYALGHILHLIEDASVPDHTRNDPHPALNHDDSFGTGSPYELWTEQFTPENIDLSKNLAGKNLVLLADLDAYFDSIANYSNNNFYSKDTIGLGEYKAPEPDYFEKESNILYGFKEDREDGDYKLVVNKNPQGSLLGVNKLLLRLNDDRSELVLHDYWSRLSVKAAQHGAGVIDLFFKEVGKAKKNQTATEEKSQSFLGSLFNTINSNDNFQPVAEVSLDNNQTSNNQSEEAQLSSEAGLPTADVAVSQPPASQPPQIQTEAPATPEPVKQQVCSFNTSQSPLKEKLIINEVAWMGTTNSANDEWIELKNVSNANLDLTGWQIIDQGEQIKIILGKSAVLAGGFYLLERTDDASVPDIKADAIYAGALSNTNEGLRLFNKDCVLIDEVVANPDWPAGNNSEKKTLERDLGGSFGWHTSSRINGTPKTENTQVSGSAGSSSGGSASVSLGGSSSSNSGSAPPTPPAENPGPSIPLISLPNHPVISEVLFDAEGADTGKEFIELYNPTEQAIDISSWSIQHLSGNGSLTKKNFETGNIIQSKSFFLIWLGDDPRADLKWLSGGLNNTGATIFLVNNTEPVATSGPVNVVDRLGYGSGTEIMPEMIAMQLTGISAGQSLERKAFENGVCVSSQNTGEFLGNGCDIDNNSNDFEIRTIPSPQNRQSLPEPRQAPATIQNLNISYDPTTLQVVFNWSPTSDFNGATSSLNYQIASRNSPLTLLGQTASTSYIYPISEIGKDYNFEISAVDKDGFSSLPATSTLNVPSFLNKIYFYGDPRQNSGAEYLVDLHWTDYPFIKKSLFDGGPEGGWKLAVFYLNKNAEIISNFYSDQQYQNEPEGQWGTAIPGALKIKYGACTGNEFISTSLILPDSAARCSINYGGYRNLTMSWGYFSEDPHLLLNFDSSQFSAPLTGQDYLTAAFYSYSGFNTQTLVAVDKTKYFFSETVPVHQAPQLNGEINLDFDPDSSRLSIDWPKATDSDSPDGAVTYEIQYAESGDWYDLGSQNSAVRFVDPVNGDFPVQVRAKDELGNYSEELRADFSVGDFDEPAPPFLLSSLECESEERFSNKLAFKYVSQADDEIISRIRLSQRYYDHEPLASVKVYSYVNDENPEAGELLAVSNEISAISPYPVWQTYDYNFPVIRLGQRGSSVWFVVENNAGASSLETKVCRPGSGVFLVNNGSWFKWPDPYSNSRLFWHQIYYKPLAQ